MFDQIGLRERDMATWCDWSFKPGKLPRMERKDSNLQNKALVAQLATHKYVEQNQTRLLLAAQEGMTKEDQDEKVPFVNSLACDPDTRELLALLVPRVTVSSDPELQEARKRSLMMSPEEELGAKWTTSSGVLTVI